MPLLFDLHDEDPKVPLGSRVLTLKVPSTDEQLAWKPMQQFLRTGEVTDALGVRRIFAENTTHVNGKAVKLTPEDFVGVSGPGLFGAFIRYIGALSLSEGNAPSLSKPSGGASTSETGTAPTAPPGTSASKTASSSPAA